MSGQIEAAPSADHSQHSEPGEADESTSTDISLSQHSSGGKGRLNSLRENLHKQQERLTALRDRALRKSDDSHRGKSSMSDSVESLKSLGLKMKSRGTSQPPDSPHMLNELSAHDVSTPLVTPSKDVSGTEKLQMLNQRTEQNRALLEQRKRDMAKSLQSVKLGRRQSTELGSSMNDLRTPTSAAAVSRHWSVTDLQLQAQQQQQQQQQQTQAQVTDAGLLKLLKNKMKLIEMKQSRKEQELQQELNDLRNELTQREQLIQQLETKLSEKSDNLENQQSLTEQENARLHTEIEQLRERNAELKNSSEMLETTRLELHCAREQLLEQQASQAASVMNTTDAQVNAELVKQLQELENQLQELRNNTSEQQQPESTASNESERLAELEAIIESQAKQLATQSETLAEKTTELNVLNVNLRVLEEKLAQSVKSKPLFLDDFASDSSEEVHEQLQQLKHKLDECNKSNIKLKLKCKQTEKQLEKMQGQDTQQELARLSAENEQLQQRITVLEDEKGQWQLAHVEEDELVAKKDVKQQESAASKRTSIAGQTETIRLLEEQKEELQQALEALQLGSETARVESELNEVQLEEQLSQRVQQLESEANEQRQQLQTLQAEKEALDKKLNHYINENMELLDKLEKLSSSSSAESIEIVERPTERRFSQRPGSEGDEEAEPNVGDQPGDRRSTKPAVLPSFVSELTQTDLAAPELEVNETLAQLRNESDELHQKIELFTNERREVLAKMEQLLAENVALQSDLKIAQEQLRTENATREAEENQDQEQLREQNTALQTQLKHTQEQLQAETAALHSQLEELQRDKQQLSVQLNEKSNLSQELSSMQRSSEVVAALDCGEGGAALFDKCERSLSKLSSELEAYRKANDRNAKLNVSKKLAKEAKNVHIQLSELLHKVKEASTAVETVTVVETVVAVTAPNGKALAEYEQLTAHNAELKSALAALQAELDELRDRDEPQETTKPLAIAQLEEDPQAQREREMQQERLQEQDTIIKELRTNAEEQQEQLDQLQSVIGELRAAEAEHLQLIDSQSSELEQLRLQAEKFDQSLNSSEMAHEKHMEQQQRLRHELEARIETLEGEQRILQALVAEQKQQLIESYSESEYEINLKMLDLQQCQQELDTSEARNKELREKLMKFALNLKKRAAEQSELEKQLQKERATVDELQEKLRQVEGHGELQLENARLQAELKQLQQHQQQKQEQHLHKMEQLQQDNDRLHNMMEQLQTTNKELQQQILKQQSKLNSLPKLKEEVDRLQVELQNTVHANTALRKESYRMEMAVAEQANVEELRRQLEQKSLKFDKSKEVIKQRNATILQLRNKLSELHAQQEQAQPAEEQEQLVQQLQSQVAKMSEEKANFERTIERLETLHDGIQAKLQQDQSYIESLEAQTAKLQATCAALEDQAVVLRSHELSAKEQLQLLEQKLREAHAQQAEHESQLTERLRQLTEREQSQTRQLQLLGNEAEEARDQLQALHVTHEALVARHKQLTEQAQAEREQLNSSSEQELQELRQELQARNLELQRQRQLYDAKLAAKATELDELECDLSAHMERATVETRDLTQQLERAQEQLQARGEELTRLNEELADVERERATLSREVIMLRLQHDSAEQDVLELQELRMQSIQDKTEIDNLRTQIESLCANHSQELQALQQQIAELDTLGQNQTDDQVYIETENKRLAEQLTEMQARLEEQAEQLARQQQQPQQQQQQQQQQATDDWMSWSRPAPAVIQQTQRPPIAVSTEQNMAIPAPAIFFGVGSAAPSPFDEIVPQPLRMTTQNLGMSIPQSQPVVMAESSGVEPTIEDLQRNVSDLEKHAKELETKLLARNQALAEHEERRAQLERLLTEREQELSQLRAAAEERERVAAIEALIQPTTTAPTLDMFFGSETVPNAAAVSLDLGLPQTEPVIEPIITPKKAYLCQPEQEQQQQQQTKPTNDWGVDVDEDPWTSAGKEEQLKDTTPELLSRIEELESQKVKLQTKVAKLMKCVKEYRTKEQARNSNNNDLDSAIIDELKHQLQLQEARQSKTEDQLQQQTLEKEKLTKRIDVLTAGNERMAELKERQDRDVQMYQTRIRELQEKLKQLESWGDVAATVAAPTPAPVEPPTDEAAQARIENLMAENQDLNSECQELMLQLQQAHREREKLQEELEAYNQHAEQVKQQAEQQKQQAEQQKQQAEEQAEQVKQLAEQVKQQAEQQKQQAEQQKLQAEQDRQQAEQERQQALLECQQLQLQLDELRTKQLELPAAVSTPSDESMALLQEKESEIVHLKQRIEELMREDQTEKLVLEILTKNQELHLLRMQVKELQEDKLEQEEKQAAEMVGQAQKEVEAKLQVELEQMRRQCSQLEQEKSDMEEELRVLNNHVISSLELEEKMKQTVLELDMKNIEITELHKTLDVLQQSQAQVESQPPPQPQPDLAALNKQWEALVEQKCSEVASIWQEHLTQREADYKAQIEQLNAAAATAAQQATPVQQPQAQQQQQQAEVATDNVNEIMSKMQSALETQEMEIVTLKEQLAIRSAEYARLASQYDPFRLQNTLGTGAAGPGGPAGQHDSPSEYVLKSDLDYALMMLHQRDMRVEEMIVELVQLLEERDHLQLKLSDTLRQLEAERSGAASGSANVTASFSSAGSASPNKLSGGNNSSSSSGELSAAATASGSDLKQKLAELQTVKHSKDKVIVDEREQRLRQMLQLQRDMAMSVSAPTPTDESSPPTSQQQLATDPTESALRSPSMVLMDWILGNNKNEDEVQKPVHQNQDPVKQQPSQSSHSSAN